MKISIVTPCLNRCNMIVDAVESVMAQGFPDMEHIIIDGGSTDGTLEVLARYPHLRMVSEPDEGIYDAMNKGIAMANGDIIGHLNSDDVYRPGTLNTVAQAFHEHPEADALCGNAQVVEGNTVVLDCSNEACRELTARNALLGLPIINARFFRRRCYEKVGVYNQGFPIVADRDFLLRAVLNGIRSCSIDKVFYDYRMHDGSATFTNSLRSRIRLCRDNLALADAWLDTDGPDARNLRRISRELMGKSVLHLTALLIRQGDFKAASQICSQWRGQWSPRPLLAAAAALSSRYLGVTLPISAPS